MGRFGKLPVELKDGVKAVIDGAKVSIAGPKGNLSRVFRGKIKIVLNEEGIVVEGRAPAAAVQGSARAHIANMVHGVVEGWKKELEVSGPGYRAEVRGKDLVLMVGYSHPVTIAAPEGVVFGVEKNIIRVEGVDKEVVGQTAALIRDTRRPSPYTGSGIRYTTETVRRKVGKQAGKTE